MSEEEFPLFCPALKSSLLPPSTAAPLIAPAQRVSNPVSLIATENPFDLFRQWFNQAAESEPKYADAMALATVDEDGMPSVRTVLLKTFDERGFVFFTNHESRKGIELIATPKAALCFYWKSIDRQVRIRGNVEVISEAENKAYFASRPRESQIGAWASRQSQVISGREELEARFHKYAAEFEGEPVPRPPHWAGFRVVPTEIEFWKEGPYRLHDRVLYGRSGDGWTWVYLSP